MNRQFSQARLPKLPFHIRLRIGRSRRVWIDGLSSIGAGSGPDFCVGPRRGHRRDLGHIF